jgi:hypothetical protein
VKEKTGDGKKIEETERIITKMIGSFNLKQ